MILACILLSAFIILSAFYVAKTHIIIGDPENRSYIERPFVGISYMGTMACFTAGLYGYHAFIPCFICFCVMIFCVLKNK